MDEQKLQELMDACRAGTRDLQEAEMRELAQAVESDPRVAQWLHRSQQCDDTRLPLPSRRAGGISAHGHSHAIRVWT